MKKIGRDCLIFFWEKVMFGNCSMFFFVGSLKNDFLLGNFYMCIDFKRRRINWYCKEGVILNGFWELF